MLRRAFPSLLLRAGLRYLLRHRWQGMLALTGIALGVAVVLAVDLANRGARAAFELSAAQLQGAATHRLIAADGTLPESLYVALRRQPGHPPMAPVVTDWVRVAGQAGRYRLVGLDLFAEGPFRGRLAAVAQRRDFIGDWLTRPDALVLGAATARQFGVAAGDPLQIAYRDRLSALRLLAIDPAVVAGGEDLLLVDIATAQSVLGLAGRLSHVDLILDAAAEQWLRERLPEGVQLVTVAEDAAGVTRLSAAFELNLTAMSLLALLVGMFLIFNAMSFSIVQRRSLLGRLRAVGVTPRELFLLILAEAAILGVLGTVVGLLLGVWLGEGLTRLVAATVSELYYEVSVAALHLEPVAFLKAGGLGLAATLAASLVPARQAAWTPPLTTLSRAALEQATQRRLPWLAGLGLAALVCGLTRCPGLAGRGDDGFLRSVSARARRRPDHPAAAARAASAARRTVAGRHPGHGCAQPGPAPLPPGDRHRRPDGGPVRRRRCGRDGGQHARRRCHLAERSAARRSLRGGRRFPGGRDPARRGGCGSRDAAWRCGGEPLPPAHPAAA